VTDPTRKRDELIGHLEAALALADEVGDSVTGYLIETALDQARAGGVGFGAALRPEAEAENEERCRKTKAEMLRRRSPWQLRDR
jgi:hypothetical protein